MTSDSPLTGPNNTRRIHIFPINLTESAASADASTMPHHRTAAAPDASEAPTLLQQSPTVPANGLRIRSENDATTLLQMGKFGSPVKSHSPDANDAPTLPQQQPAAGHHTPGTAPHYGVPKAYTYNPEDADAKTILIFPENKPTNKDSELPPAKWVHGWLLATEGPLKGRSFPITYGNNTVGRSTGNTICLPHDKKISRTQFSIRFVRKKCCYIVSPIATATQITYVGEDDELYMPTPIHEGDLLRVSPDTTLRFIPFCDKQFQWDYAEILKNGNPPEKTPIPSVSIRSILNARIIGTDSRKSTATSPTGQPEQGCLVAISGPMKGRYFPLYNGLNQAGSSSACPLCLSADSDISAIQLEIQCDKNSNSFFVNAHTEATQSTHLNDALLQNERTPIVRGDFLQLSGQTTLRFIPFCHGDYGRETTSTI